MKKVLLCSICLCAPLSAEQKIFGPKAFQDTTLSESLIVIGPLKATGLTAQNLRVFGNTRLTNSSIGTLKVVGNLWADSTSFHGPVDVTGHVSAKNSKFLNDLILTGSDIALELENTKAENITIDNKVYPQRGGFYLFSSALKKTPTVKIDLKNKTEVNGNLVFEGSPEKVIMDSSSSVTGHIIPTKIFEETDEK